MKFVLAAAAAAALAGAAPARADVPRVVADIAPVHSLVARVMAGVGTPSLTVPATANPHDFALRPSQARALQEAELVVWTGDGITPIGTDRLADLAPDAAILDLMALEDGTTHLPRRTDVALTDEHDHGGDHAHEDGEDHGDHEEHGDHDDHADHAEGDAADHAHLHETGGIDPHTWLDPVNARIFVAEIAARLSDLDPANAAAYAANARAADAEIAAVEAEVAGRLDGASPRFLVLHDALQYFEALFGLEPLGAVIDLDGEAASAGRLRDLEARLAEAGADCVLAEPQFDVRLAATVAPGVPVVEADPLGVTLEPGPELYPALLRNLADSFAACG